MSLLKLKPSAHLRSGRPLLPSRIGAPIFPRHSHSAVHAVPPFVTFNRSRLVAGALILAAGSALAVSQSNSDSSTSTLPPPAVDSSDPLSALTPHILMSATSHLGKLSVADLCRQYIVYLASSQSSLVSSGPWILKQLEWTRDNVPVVGSVVWGIFTITMEGTFYKVFVGGASVPECAPIVEKYLDQGIGCLLNYSAEASVDGSATAKCGLLDSHITEACAALRAAAKLGVPSASTSEDFTSAPYTIKPTLLAIKLTGLISEPALLARASTALVGSSAYQRGTLIPSSFLFPQSPSLSDEDHEILAKLHDGLKRICAEARDGGVRLFVDAEQSWFQPAIDRIVDLLSEEFNVVNSENAASAPAIPVIHNTYQAYLRTTPPTMAASAARADALGYSFGAKLVRGAYVESERIKHTASGADGKCCVWDNKAETDACYDELSVLLEKRVAHDIVEGKPVTPGTGAFFASHNGTSFKKVLAAFRDDGLAKNVDGGLDIDDRVRGRISFAQLLGMSDNLSMTLTDILAPSTRPSASGEPQIPIVVKWVPYATVDQALPYLIRRANESQAILQSDPTSGRGGAVGERRAIGRELRSRMGLSF
ncbi:proline dehydrogenase, partial [Phenoliferia sp. Uapishka_3]